MFVFRMDQVFASNYYLDILSMTPSWAWAYLLLGASLIAGYVVLNEKPGPWPILCSFLMYVGLFVLSQYPTMVFRDVYLHGGLTLQVLNNGLATSGYPQWWPGAFVLWAISLVTTGMSVFESDIVLVLVTQSVIACLFYLIGRRVNGERLASAAGALYLVSSVYFYQDLNHFSPALLSIALFLALLYLLIRSGPVLMTQCFSVLLATGLILVHPLGIVFVLGGLLVSRLLKAESSMGSYTVIGLVAFAVILDVTWILNSAQFSVIELSRIVLYALTDPTGTKLGTIILSPFGAEQLSVVGYVLQDYYFKPMLGVIGVLALLGYVRMRGQPLVKFLGTFFLGCLLVSATVFVSGRFEQGLQIERALTYALIPAVFLVVSFLSKSRRRLVLVGLIFLLLVPSFYASRTFFSQYESSDHSWQTVTYSFLSNHSTASITTDRNTAIYYGYFVPNQTVNGALFLLQYSQQNLTDLSYIVATKGLFLRSFEMELIENPYQPSVSARQLFWEQVDMKLDSTTSINRLYSDGLMTAYLTGQ